MMALAATRLPAGEWWTYEVKWDGYRTIAIKEGARVRLYSRNVKDVTAHYPSIARAVAAARPHTLVLDGELVALDDSGRPSFQALHHQSPAALVYYVFDLLHLDDRDLEKAPLASRREALGRALAGTELLQSEPLPGTPEQIERAVRALDLEGVVAKRADSRYEPGKRSGAWIKVKFSRRQEFVVGGYKPGGPSLRVRPTAVQRAAASAAEGFDSLLVGYYEGAHLQFAGKVRSGFTPHMRDVVMAALEPLKTTRCPFTNLPSTKTSHWGEGVTAEEMETLRWVRPSLVVEVAFTEWTRDGNLRHAAFVGVRPDKRARDVRRET
jgi:bifunctional non-homologous end joining protein LigD